MFQAYLPKRPNGEYEAQMFAGDQLSVERAVNLISSVANGYTPEDRFEGINLQLGDWHAGLKLLTVSMGRGIYTEHILVPVSQMHCCKAQTLNMMIHVQISL